MRRTPDLFSRAKIARGDEREKNGKRDERNVPGGRVVRVNRKTGPVKQSAAEIPKVRPTAGEENS